MVWKLINIDNQGTESTYGGDDIKKINKYLSGYNLRLENTSDDVNINTDTTFGSENLRLASPTSGFKYIFRTQELSADRIISLPLMLDDGEIALSAAGAATDWGDFPQTFRHQNIIFRNPANTFSYIWNMGAITANRNILLPVLTGDDTIAFCDATQTFTNKTFVSPTFSAMTINTDSNTIKHSTTNNTGDILVNNGSKFDRKARGTANQIFAMNATGTDTTWIDQSQITGGGGGGSTTGLPVSTVNSVIWGAAYAMGALNVAGCWNGAVTDTGTVAPVAVADGTGRIGLRYNWTVDDDRSGFRSNFASFCRMNDPELWVRYKYVSNGFDQDYRVQIGFVSDPAADYGSDGALASKSAFMWFKEPADTVTQIGKNDGDASQDKDPAVSLASTDENVNTIRIFADNTNNRFGISLNNAAATYVTTEIPAATTPLGCIVQWENEDANDRSLEFYGAYFKCKVL